MKSLIVNFLGINLLVVVCLAVVLGVSAAAIYFVGWVISIAFGVMQITWIQAFAISFIILILKAFFGR